jgi:type II secretory pathway pseudopilin PulG
MFDFLMQHQLWSVLLVLAVLSTAACAAHYKVHPGALNAADSAAYDTLLVAEAAIDQARTENQSRPLPAQAKEALNTLVDSYNVARTAWLAYRGAIATNTPSDEYFRQLTRNLTDLTQALEDLKRREVKP